VLDELKARLPKAEDVLALTAPQLDEILLSCLVERVENKNGPIRGERFFSAGELEELYPALEMPPDRHAWQQEINNLLAEALHRLQTDNFVMRAPGQLGDAMTVTTKGRQRSARGSDPVSKRRLAAILDLDAVGFSRLTGLDEDGTLEQLRTVRAEAIDPTIAQCGGRIFKTTGDGLLAVFDSVVDAVRCAIAVQAAISNRHTSTPADRRLVFRGGVHHGDVVAEGDDLLGDGVNIAARLQVLALPGGVCVSARVQEDVEGKLGVSFVDMGEQHLKIIQRPIRVYRVYPGRPPQGGLTLDQPRSSLKISVGESGSFFRTHSEHLHSTMRTLNLRLDNISNRDAVTGIKLAILSIEPQSEYFGPWMLVENRTLAAGDHCFIPLAIYQEADTTAGYSTSRYDRSASFFEILSTSNRPKPSKETPQFVTIRATGIGSAPCDYRCKIWVEQPDGRLRIADAADAST
jgi:class 3 adenylate cyclase